MSDAGPRLAVTFDGGSTSNGSEGLLDLLNHLDLRVTLFLTGQFMEREPALVRRAVLSGHEVGNHTWTHPHLTTYERNRRHDLLPGVTRESFVDELRRTEEIFQRISGRSLAPLWRAPYGEENDQLRAWALAEGYLHVRWSSLSGKSLDSHDWAPEHSRLYQSAGRTIDRLLGFPQLEGGIVLMHVGTDRATPPWRELPRFLDALGERGIEPVTVTELLTASRKWRPWLEQAREAAARREDG